MYYILNETNQIIAADTDLLELCGLTHIDELTLSIALGKTKFDLISKENLVITADDNDKTYPISKISLSSMLGHLTLIDIKISEEKSEDTLSLFKIDELEDTEESIIYPDLDAELLSIKPDIREINLTTEPADDDNALFDLDFHKEETVESIEDTLHILTDDTDTYDLDFSIKEEETKEEESHKAEPIIDDSAEILIDVEKVSQQIGVSEEDYDTFLNEYIDTALELEKDLQSSDTEKRSNAIGTLSHLSDLLQLPVMSNTIAKIDSAAEEKRGEIIESFYSALSRITTSQTSQTFEEEPKIELFDTAEEVKPAAEINKNSFGVISLEGIKPIHFDFRLEEAANDLSLPVDLIEEFVHDFIEQAHIETEKMLKAYEKGDLDAIQKIGHLLKGASSNLRINALSDTLYKIQFCEDSSNLEHYIKDYWGHFLSFEIQINALAK